MIEQRKHYFNALKKVTLNELLELKGNIRVLVRIRPILPVDFTTYAGAAKEAEELVQIKNKS